ncbi:hypothetical protein [Dyadobacter sediminis]|uniref:Uncharacterized protein n=1 Tax=Dyadobacter sediminis TaxID=1493691 RepID=A0A5R9KBL0_9BACT|nr:hypothetical protein [Dyadobacter sediminis]TLU92223.1 hypothetical protein FEM55_15900 [Dyadobacter sediminis]GGB96409.1 hypothetical protein GCM10011325_24660 [Dyadobacter sediminis]
MSETIQRKISVKLATPHGADFTMHILPAMAGSLQADSHPAVAKLAEQSTGAADQAKYVLEQLIARDEDFTRWLESSPENSILFVNDPVSAIRQALPDLPANLYEQWSHLSQHAAAVENQVM